MHKHQHEQAILEEKIWIIAHLLNACEHLVEYSSTTNNTSLASKISQLRELRKIIVENLFNIEFSSNEKIRSSADNLWCTMKHLMSAMMHAEEVSEKMAENNNLKEYIFYAKVFRAIMKTLIDIIEQLKTGEINVVKESNR